VVWSLRESGLTIRAIASAAGIDKNTVQSDLAQVSEIHTPAGPVDADALADELIAAEVVDAEVAEPKPITGLDGKTYQPKPKPRQPKPKPLLPEWELAEAAGALLISAEEVKHQAALIPFIDDPLPRRYRDKIADAAEHLRAAARLADSYLAEVDLREAEAGGGNVS